MATSEIRSPAEYDEVLAEIERLVQREPTRGTPEFDALEQLSSLADEYRARAGNLHHADDLPVEAEEVLPPPAAEPA